MVCWCSFLSFFGVTRHNCGAKIEVFWFGANLAQCSAILAPNQRSLCVVLFFVSSPILLFSVFQTPLIWSLWLYTRERKKKEVHMTLKLINNIQSNKFCQLIKFLTQFQVNGLCVQLMDYGYEIIFWMW